MKDLTRIGESFVHHLTGILHSRIQYPEEESGATDSDEKSPEKEN
jgi:membrane-associated HD superfamily phosphohydrolase